MIAVDTMRATVFHAPQEFHVEEVDRPRPGPGEALIRVTLTTICGTDVHIVKGEYPVKPGLILGHEPVGLIHELGSGLEDDYSVGHRVIVEKGAGSGIGADDEAYRRAGAVVIDAAEEVFSSADLIVFIQVSGDGLPDDRA